jgi:hypothetical protein
MADDDVCEVQTAPVLLGEVVKKTTIVCAVV